MESANIAIVGAGFAGAAAAYFLAKGGFKDIVVLEQEVSPGIHASGRNAAMVRQLISDPAMAKLAREGARFIASQPEDWERHAEFQPNGSLLLAEGKVFEGLKKDVDEAQRHGLDVELLSPAQCVEKSPWIDGDRFDGGAFCPSDGVVDIAGLLEIYLAEATRLGARVRFGEKVTAVHSEQGQVRSVETNHTTIEIKTLINASGAWAGEIGRMAGAQSISFTPYRRHLFVTEKMPDVNPAWPFAWDISHEAYFRPEPPGLLLCACDEMAMLPGTATEDPAAMEFLAEKMAETFPRLCDVSISRHWAGLRTMAPDHRFVIGWDKKVSNFFWLAGMGGHGVTTSAALGRICAEFLTGEPERDAGVFDPSRFGSA